MRNAFAILMIIPILLQAFSKGIVILDFKMSQDYIAKYLCENRDKPQMHCNGQCHLRKALEKDEQKSQAPNQSSRDKWDPGYYDDHISYHFFSPAAGIRLTDRYQQQAYASPHFSFFHPPCCREQLSLSIA